MVLFWSTVVSLEAWPVASHPPPARSPQVWYTDITNGFTDKETRLVVVDLIARGVKHTLETGNPSLALSGVAACTNTGTCDFADVPTEKPPAGEEGVVDLHGQAYYSSATSWVAKPR